MTINVYKQLGRLGPTIDPPAPPPSVIVELLRDDGTVADTQPAQRVGDGIRVTFRDDVEGLFTHARIALPNGERITCAIAPHIRGGIGVTPMVTADNVFPTYRNPAWRWYHGENHELTIKVEPSPRWEGRELLWCEACRTWQEAEWYGLPKPTPRPHSDAIAKRFQHVRDHVWIAALGAESYGALADMQLPGWPQLFAFHAWTAIWETLPEDEQIVLLDPWEARYLGDACKGRACEGAA